MAHDRVPRYFGERLLGRVNSECGLNGLARNDFRISIEKIAIERRHPIGILIRLAAQHYAINVLEVLPNFVRSLDAAVDHEGQKRKILFQPINKIVP